MVWPAVIGAGASLLGGIFGKPKKQSAEKNSYDGIMGQARGARDASDRYGFNPLTLLGASSAIGPSTSANYMGNAIADAGMIVADGLAKRSEQLGQITKLTEENELLRKEIQNQTLRPKVAGVYAQRQMTPSLGGALGRGGRNGSSEDDSLDYAGDMGVQPHSATHRLDTRPPIHPFDRPILQVPVRDVGGGPITLPKPVVDRIDDLEPWGQMIAEDYEDLYGDETGQVVMLPKLGDILGYHHTGKPTDPILRTPRGKSPKIPTTSQYLGTMRGLLYGLGRTGGPKRKR